MHLWHDIDPLKIKFHVRAVVEISQGSRQKYEVDPELGILSLDRSLLTPCRYPIDYGFIPRTLGLDSDPLDIFILSKESLLPGVLVTTRPIGLFDLITDGESDHKIIAVTRSDPEYGSIQSLRELSSARLRELRQFLQTYKALENKNVKVGNFLGPQKAWSVIRHSMKVYQKKFQPSKNETEKA